MPAPKKKHTKAKTSATSPPKPTHEPTSEPAATIEPTLKVETVEINSLSFDSHNARLHNQKNIETIKSSLRRFGQQKPIVVDSNNIVRAGNGTLAGAMALGWKQIAIVRSDLTGPEMTAYALVDNRSAELAEWEKDILAAELGGLREEDVNLEELGWDDKDLKSLLGDFQPAEGDWPELNETTSHSIVVRYADEDEAAIKKFIGDESISLTDGRAGKKLLERIKAATPA